MRSIHVIRGLAVLICALVMAGCDRPREDEDLSPRYVSGTNRDVQEMVLAVHPLHNPQKLHEVFSPLIEYLNRKVPGVRFFLEASRDYASFDSKLYSGQFQFALPNPYQTITALKHGYHVFAKMGEDQDFRGIFIVRKDSGIKGVTDLVGKKVAYPAPTALAACIMPQYFLHAHGIDVTHDIDNRYVGSQESSIMNVYLGNVAAGATWPPPWRAFVKEHPDMAAELEVIWETEPLVNNSFMVRDDVAPEVVREVRDALLELPSHAEGRAILASMETCCIDAAEDATYQPVIDFVRKFSRSVRPLE